MINQLKKDKITLLVSICISFIYIIPFIVNNNYVVDDWLRADTGVTAWEGNGRPLSSIIMSSITMFGGGVKLFGDGALYDIFPFTIIACSFIMIFCGYIICNELNVKSELMKILCIISPLTTTFFIGNLYFRFDSLIMSLACLGAIYQSRLSSSSSLTHWIISIFVGFISISIYQASIPFLLTYHLISCYGIHEKGGFRRIYIVTMKMLASLISSFILYKVMIHAFFSDSAYTSSYTKIHSEIIPINIDGIHIFYENFISFLSLIYKSSSVLFIYITCIILVISISFAILLKQRKALPIFVLIPLVILTSFAPYLLLKSPIVEPRVLISFGLVFCLIAKSIDLLGKNKVVSCVLFLYLSILNFSQAYGVSNAFNTYQRIDRVTAQYISDKLIDKGYKTGDKIVINGFPSYPDSVKRIYSTIPVSKYLVGSSFANYRFKYSLMKQYGISSPLPLTDKFSGKGIIVIDNNLIKLIKFDDGYQINIKRM
ncbi:hypothetical protein EYY83_18985 [Hafnia alvei]|uniref:glucosyltransferase domain-containing protein n=1 Tax=Hafnia alvei TaxID=569 RepID=UPI0010335504|nr:glucosyltransferase domain-containing protein [Hafnia alvei]TBM10106.1 hypothetical protein EYY83_18985 [Hafnia alvei]